MAAAELVGGLLSNSLALLGDAAHMFTDTLALGLAYVGVRFLARPPTRRATFGFQRVEVLSAWLNGLLLVGVSGVLAWRAYRRLMAPEPVDGTLMLSIAILGLLANGVALFLVHGHQATGIGARSAYLHIVADSLTSVAAVVGGVMVWRWNLVIADSLLALLIVLFVLRGAYLLVRDASRILLETVPEGLGPRTIEAMLLREPGVAGVHDVHVWSLTSGVHAATAHVALADMALADAIRIKDRLKELLHDAGLHHVVLEIDRAADEPNTASLRARPPSSPQTPGQQN